MRRTRRFVASGIASLPMIGLPRPVRPSTDARAIQEIIERARDSIRQGMEGQGILGVSAALLSEGAPIWIESFGSTGGATPRPVGGDTIFSLQSTSKNFCAIAVMLAVQRGLLELDRPIAHYLPRFTVASRHEPRPQEKMTLRLLLSHRCGFTHEAPVGNNFAPESPSFEAHVDSISRTWLRYRVGERFAYSNLGVDLAGRILATVMRAPYGECLRELIFDPLGMSDATATPDIYAARQNRAVGHEPGFDAVPLKVPMEAAGGVYASVNDMARYAAFHLGRGSLHGQRLLSRDLWAEMHAFPYRDSPAYSLGVQRYRVDLKGGRFDLYFHEGGGFGFGSSFVYCPKPRLAWVVLFNGQTRAGPRPELDRLAIQPILEHTFGPPMAPRPAIPPRMRTVRPSREALARYVGTYVDGTSQLTMSLEDDTLAYRFLGEVAATPLTFTRADTAWVTEGRHAPLGARFLPAKPPAAAYVRFSDGSSLDYNDSDADPPGPITGQYNAHLGTYQLVEWGKPVARVTLRVKNGYLYVQNKRTTEYAQGLLFTADGEALDLRSPNPTVRNILLHTVAT